MPTARFWLGTCEVNGKIYAIGGAPAPHVGLSVVEVYDPGTDTWTRKADMPTARGFLSTSVVNGKIYAIGGALGTSGPAFRTVEEYDPATNTWARKADLPEPRYLHAASVVDGKVYIIAGSWQAYTASRAVYAYDPATDTWERKADAPTARSWLSASAVDGRIYVIGGDVPPKANMEEYDPATDTWTRRADMPTPRGALSTTALNGKIYVIGGTATTAYKGLSTVEEYDPKPPLVVDFNGDGTVDIKDLLRLIQSWGQDDPMVDIAPPPFGDGIVDALDPELLMSYWGQEVDDPTLVMHWALNEAQGTIAYDSAAQNDAFLIGGPVWQPEGGRAGGALAFDGVDDYAFAQRGLNPADGPFSVLAWVKGGAPGQVVISQLNGVNWLNADPAQGCLMTELCASGRGAGPLQSGILITDGAWHRIGFAWDGSCRALYVDDILVAEGAQQGLSNSVGGLKIGCGNDSAAGTFWSGLIDDVRIYNRAISP